MGREHLLNVYNPLPLSPTHGEGIYLFDADNKKYLDANAGIAVCNLGHSHPAITKTIQDQASKLLHVSNRLNIPEQVTLADTLCKLTHTDRAFFCNSGAEAVEGAIKLCRLYGHKKNIDLPGIIVMDNAFHGRTLAASSASGMRNTHAGFEPLVRGFVRAPYNDIEALKSIAKTRTDIVAIMLEPIQGNGGVIMPDDNYLSEIRKLCDEHEWLMIADEVQTGIGRTGKLFAYEHANVQPDVVIMAKGLANGIPIGAFVVRGEAAELFTPGSHGATFGGNPLASRVASKVLEIIEKDNIIENAAHMGELLMSQLQEKLGAHPLIKEIRGCGLLIGVEFHAPCTALSKIALERGLIFSMSGSSIVRLLPPLIINKKQVKELVDTLTACVEELASQTS